MIKLSFSLKNPIVRFGLVVLFLLALWKLFYNNWLLGLGINDPITACIGDWSNWILLQFGYASYCQQVDTNVSLFLQRVTIFIDGNKMVTIDDSCNGLELYALLIGFVVSYGKGNLSWFFSSLFLVLSVLFIFFINVFRIVGLALLVYYRVPHFHVFHKYVFAAVVYLIILGMMWLWTYWVNQSLLKEKIVD
jgi:exosortase/archaeosortase family protein